MGITNYSIKREGRDVALVSVLGDIDAYTAPKVRCGLRTAIRDPDTTELRVDLAEVSFLDSSGVDALVRCRAEARSRGIGFVVINPQSHPRKVLDLLGLTEFFGITPDDEARY